MELVHGPGLPVVGQGLERQLQVGEGIGIEQLPQLLLAEQLPEQVAIEGKGPGPALGERRIAPYM